MSIILSAGTDVLVYIGDSITDQGWQRGGLMQAIRTAAGRKFVFAPTMETAARGGTTIAQWTANIDTWLTPFGPTAVIVNLGTNTPSTNVQADMQAFIDAMRARWPAIKILLVSVFLAGDNWPNGANAGDAERNAQRTAQNAAAAARAVDIIDVRTPAFAYLDANNPGHAANGILTTDGIHPNVAGQLLMSNTVWNSGLIIVTS